MKIVICDDNSLDATKTNNSVINYFASKNKRYDTQIINDGATLLNYKDKIDILLLDIDLGNYDGIELMNNLINKNNIGRIIFVSSHDERVFDSFSLKTLGFVVKPIDEAKLSKWLDIATQELEDNHILKLLSPSGDVYVSEADIIFVVADRNNSIIKCINGDISVMISLKKLETLLSKKHFLRVHKSHIVNMMHIDRLGTECSFKNFDENIPVGRKYIASSRQAYDEYFRAKIMQRMM